MESDAPVVFVNITDNAAEKAKALLAASELLGGGLRVFVAGGGCSGYQYGLTLDPSAAHDDIIIEQSGVLILIDPESAEYVAGAQIDYGDDIKNSGFSISNPNATQSCACGASFQIVGGGPRLGHRYAGNQHAGQLGAINISHPKDSILRACKKSAALSAHFRRLRPGL